MSEMVNHVVVSLDMHGICVKGKMVNIYPILAIDISRTPSKIENVYVDVYFSLEEIKIYNNLFKEF
jgi:hypothetical protein